MSPLKQLYVDNSPTSITALARIQRIYGPMLIGSFCSMILYGIIIVQVYNYFITYGARDLRVVRYLVIYLLVVETIHSGFEMIIMYQPLVIDFGNTSVEHLTPMMLPAESILMVSISTPMQIFLAWRISRVQGSYWIPGVIVVLALTSLAGGLWTGSLVAIVNTYAKTKSVYPAVYTWLFSSALADCLIAGALSFSLWKHQVELPTANAVLARIIRWTLRSGAVMCSMALIDVLLLVLFPVANWIFEVGLAKVYAMQLMSTLNDRESLNSKWNDRAANLDQDLNSLIQKPAEVLNLVDPQMSNGTTATEVTEVDKSNEES